MDTNTAPVENIPAAIAAVVESPKKELTPVEQFYAAQGADAKGAVVKKFPELKAVFSCGQYTH